MKITKREIKELKKKGILTENMEKFILKGLKNENPRTNKQN